MERRREKIREAIVAVFKHDFKLSNAVPEQQEMVELVVEDLKKASLIKQNNYSCEKQEFLFDFFKILYIIDIGKVE